MECLDDQGEAELELVGKVVARAEGLLGDDLREVRVGVGRQVAQDAARELVEFGGLANGRLSSCRTNP